MKRNLIHNGMSLLIATATLFGVVGLSAAADKKPNIVMLMQDDTGWNDFGCYSGGGAALPHPPPHPPRPPQHRATVPSPPGPATPPPPPPPPLTRPHPLPSA